MSNVVVVKDDRGRLAGFGEKGERAYNRFLAAVRNLGHGEMLAFSYKVPRSPGFHKRHFVMLKAFFDGQEQFSDDYQFRKWTEVGAGYADFLPGPKGRMVAIPKSIAYEALDDEEFKDVHYAVIEFLRSPHARSFLWGHLTEQQSHDMVEAILGEFER